MVNKLYGWSLTCNASALANDGYSNFTKPWQYALFNFFLRGAPGKERLTQTHKSALFDQ